MGLLVDEKEPLSVCVCGFLQQHLETHEQCPKPCHFIIILLGFHRIVGLVNYIVISEYITTIIVNYSKNKQDDFPY